jgi:hypothetical protein
LTVDRDVNKAGRCCSGRHIKGELQRAALRRLGRLE